MISTSNFGAASLASTQARAGAQPGATQASQTSFISSKRLMSVSQMVAVKSFVLSVPASARSLSICASVSRVCSAMLAPGASSSR